MPTYTQWTDISATAQDEVNHNKYCDIPPGNYFWDGPPLVFPSGIPVAAGGGDGASLPNMDFKLIDGKAQGITAIQFRGKATGLVDIPVNQPMPTGKITGLRLIGGTFPFISRYTGPNVYDMQVIEDVALFNFSKCGISNNAPDSPFWKLNRVIIQGANNSVAMALAGYTDSTSILDVDIRGHMIGIKLGRGGPNMRVEGVGFLHFDNSLGPRIEVWVVPEPAQPIWWFWTAPPAVAGQGLRIGNGVRFGNEGLRKTDLRIVYADERPVANTVFGDPARLPELAKQSKGYIYGHTVERCDMYGIGEDIPLVYSMTDNIAGCSWGEQCTQQGSRSPSGAPVYKSFSGKAPLGKNNVIVPPRIAAA